MAVTKYELQILWSQPIKNSLQNFKHLKRANCVDLFVIIDH